MIKRIMVQISRITRENKNHFVLDLKIEMITGLHGENELEEEDPLGVGMQIRHGTGRIRGQMTPGEIVGVEGVLGRRERRRETRGVTPRDPAR